LLWRRMIAYHVDRTDYSWEFRLDGFLVISFPALAGAGETT
jgi:hypothetical protein